LKADSVRLRMKLDSAGKHGDKSSSRQYPKRKTRTLSTVLCKPLENMGKWSHCTADDRNDLEPATVEEILDELENWERYISGEPEIIHTLRLLEEEAQTVQGEPVKQNRSTFNELGILLDTSDERKQRKITINPKFYSSFDYGYATTIHKSQGATVDNTYVLGSTLMNRHLTYVAMTRHKQDVVLYGVHNSLQKMRRSGEQKQINKYDRREQQSKYHQRRNRGPTMH